MPINGVVSQLVQIGSQPLQLGFGLRYYVDKPDGGPEWGLRFVVNFVFPR